jgi:hypothetical protein
MMRIGDCVRGALKLTEQLLLVSMKALDWFYYLTKSERKMLKTRSYLIKYISL